MTQLKYNTLKVLVVDDFSNFRSTVIEMLSKLGITDVDVASSGEEVIQRCQKGRYDVILCDYDLGVGRNGQQVLEELRYRRLVNKRTIFIIVTANASKEVVMATYDCEPDDYLMKPITAKMLQQRITRLLMQRGALDGVHKAMDSGELEEAIRKLTDISIGEGRYAVAAQKMLGELFIKNRDLSKAEKLYTKALEVRQLDWARLGLAKVKQLTGHLADAGEQLNQIIADNPLFLPAYDVLAENWKLRNEPHHSQETLQHSVAISPRSILRQKKLAATAEHNKDFETSLNALKAVVRLGQLSCHASANDSFDLARLATKNVINKIQPAEPLLSEALEQLDNARDKYLLSDEQNARANVLEGHALLLQGNEQEGSEKITQGAQRIRQIPDVSLAAHLETLAAMQAQGNKLNVEEFVEELLTRYENDQEALQKLDELLSEPVSESNQQLITTVNKEGINLYNACRFDDAIECFEKVLNIFPKHVGVHLNIVQSLVGKLKAGVHDEQTVERTQQTLSLIETLVAPGHEQFARFDRLKKMAASCLEESRIQ